MNNLNINMNLDLDSNSIESVVERINELGLDHIQGFEDVNGVSVALSYANDCCESNNGDALWLDEMNAHLDILEDNGASDDVLDAARDNI